MGINDIVEKLTSQVLTESDFSLQLVFLFMVISLAFSLYIYMIYRFSTKSTFYSPAFAKTLVGMSIITTSIIIAMQGSLIVSLGMVGALSIVRFRNAVKSPIDLLFLFWAISTGIICGTGLFNIAIVSCVIMTFVMLALDYVPCAKSSYILTVNCKASVSESVLTEKMKPYSKEISVRTRNVYANHKEILFELKTKEGEALVNACHTIDGVEGVSLIFHDGEVRF
ncbi:MAG: DUF4956 domain-containing protein [Erysipelotrichaceae bacterium]